MKVCDVLKGLSSVAANASANGVVGILPVGNGVTDGSLPIYIMFITMGIFGNEAWRTPMANAGTPFEVTAVDVFAWALIALQVQIMGRK